MMEMGEGISGYPKRDLVQEMKIKSNTGALYLYFDQKFVSR